MRRSFLTLWILPVLTGIGMLGIWYGIHGLLGPDRQFLLPAPHEILRALVDRRSELLHATTQTGLGALLGFGGAVVLSFVFALGLSLSPAIRASFYPYLMVLQLTPIIVFAPILVLWVGPGLRSVSIITFLICFFPMVVNTTQGLVSTDRALVDLFRLYRASKGQELIHLRIPAAMPYFFTGLRIAATLAPIGAVVGDFYAGNSAGGQGGLGFLTILYSAQFEMAGLFAAAAMTCLLGFVFVGAASIASHQVLKDWHESVRRTDL